MIHHFPYARDIAYQVSVGSKITPPAGFYFEGVAEVCGSEPPKIGPQAFERIGPAGIDLAIPSLNIRVNGGTALLEILQLGSSYFRTEDVLLTVTVRPEVKMHIARLTQLDLEAGDKVIVAYWSVSQSDTPTMREWYIPTLSMEDSKEKLLAQNAKLREYDNELMVRYYRLD